MKAMLFVVRVLLTVAAAALAVSLMLRLWGGWDGPNPACIGPQDTVTFCR